MKEGQSFSFSQSFVCPSCPEEDVDRRGYYKRMHGGGDELLKEVWSVIEARRLSDFVAIVILVLERTPRFAVKVLMPNDIPTRREKDTISRSQKLLQRPPSLELFTCPKRARIPRTIVFEVNVAFGALFVPPVHGIDRFRELGTTALFDAAGVHPSVAEVSLSSDTAEVYDLLIPGATLD